MNTTTLTKIVTSDLAKESGKQFVQATAIMAGVCAGSSLVTSAKSKVRDLKSKRAAKKAAKNES